MVVAMKITEHWALHSDRCLKPAHGLNAPLVIMQVAELACRPTMSWLCRFSSRFTASNFSSAVPHVWTVSATRDAARGVQPCVLARELMATGPPVASVPTLDASSCDEPRKGVVDRRPGTHRFRGCPKKPVALYVLFTIETSLPRDLPHSATCCVLHEGPMAGSDSMQRVVILPLVASLAFFIAFSSCKADAAPNRISTCARSSPILYTS